MSDEQSDEQRLANDLLHYLNGLVEPLVPGRVSELRIEHHPDCPLPGEHLYVIYAPSGLERLLIGTRGWTAGAIRTLARSWATVRGWRAAVDVRVKNDRA